MSYWNAKYPNDCGEYEITFGSKSRETTKAVEKVCTAVMDGLVKSSDDVEIVVHAYWICDCEPYHICSNCRHKFSLFDKVPRCPNCGAHMDKVCYHCDYARMMWETRGATLMPGNCDLHRDKMCPELDEEEE